MSFIPLGGELLIFTLEYSPSQKITIENENVWKEAMSTKTD